MMNPAMLPFDSRPVTSAPLQRPVMPNQYFASGSYNPAPMTSMPGPPFQPQPQPQPQHQNHHLHQQQTQHQHQHQHQHPHQHHMAFGGYGVYNTSPTAVESPHFKRHTQDYRAGYSDSSRSPSVRSDSQSSISSKSVASKPPAVPRTITSNAPINGAEIVDFDTNIDQLMKVIQSKNETEDIVHKAEAELSTLSVQDPDETRFEPAQTPELKVAHREGKPNMKRYRCDVPGCNKTFHQNTHLTIHIRAHTGERPYNCKVCKRSFSQAGNLKTHERRHTGDKPYKCDQCGKGFAQRGNVRAHLKTHDEKKQFKCRLGNCQKFFTQLGNLKTHQNKFHKETIKLLTSKFASLTNYDNVAEADRELCELWKYFATLYKNSNKGIKGRGKDRKVGTLIRSSPVTTAGTLPSQYALAPPHGLPLPMHHNLPQHGLSHPAAYSMSRPNLMVNVPGSRGGQASYDMFEVDEDTVVTHSGAISTASANIYEDRDLAFGDRMY